MADVAKIFANLEKVDDKGSNYRLWRSKLTFCARAAQASWSLERAPAANDAAETKLNDQIAAAVALSLPAVMFQKVMTLTNVHEMVERLDADYQRVTPVLKATLEQQFIRKKFCC